MIYRKQKDYDRFKCIADKCPKSCCIGWQIMIDENSLEKYQNTTGDFSDRLKTGVDYTASAFRQDHTRCRMLNPQGLCDLQTSLGENYLCDTCRLYPRHIEEFQDLREYSLSLSCPEVTRMILSADYDFGLTETEDDTSDSPEEFEDFDFLIFDQLEYAREQMLALASDPTIPLQERMERIASVAYRLQTLYDEGEILSMADISYDSVDAVPGTGILLDPEYCIESLNVLIDMENLEADWTESILATRDYWLRFAKDSKEWSETMYPAADIAYQYEKVFKSLLFTYFCGAIYDGEIYARAMIAVQSVRFLMMICAATKEDLAPTVYLYSREVEHSDPNINALISYFEEELP